MVKWQERLLAFTWLSASILLDKQTCNLENQCKPAFLDQTFKVQPHLSEASLISLETNKTDKTVCFLPKKSLPAPTCSQVHCICPHFPNFHPTILWSHGSPRQQVLGLIAFFMVFPSKNTLQSIIWVFFTNLLLVVLQVLFCLLSQTEDCMLCLFPELWDVKVMISGILLVYAYPSQTPVQGEGGFTLTGALVLISLF